MAVWAVWAVWAVGLLGCFDVVIALSTPPILEK